MDKFWIIRDGMVSGSLTAKKWPNPPGNIVKATDDVDHLGQLWNGSNFEPAPADNTLPVWSSYRFAKILGKAVWRKAKKGNNENLEFLSYLLERAGEIDMNDPEIYADIEALVPAEIPSKTFNTLRGL